MKDVLLIRHGDVEYPTDELGRLLLYGPDAVLSGVGRKQIENLTEKTAHLNLDVIYNSPLPRARQSAKIIVDKHKLRFGKEIPSVTLYDLREPELGEWVGIPIEELRALPRGWDLYSQPKPGQEAYEMLGKRVTVAIRKIVLNKDERCIAIVAHGEVIKIAAFALENINALPPKNPSEVRAEDQVGNGEAFHIVLDKSKRVVRKVKV